MLQKALKLFLLGLLLWPVLINLIGFISPIWAIYVLEDEYGMRSSELVNFFQPYVPLISILFSASLILLSQVDGRFWMKTCCWVVSLIYTGCSIYGFLPPEELLHYLLTTASFSMEIVMLFLGGLMLLRIFGELTTPEHSGDGVI